jgi:hypothetical protein
LGSSDPNDEGREYANFASQVAFSFGKDSSRLVLLVINGRHLCVFDDEKFLATLRALNSRREDVIHVRFEGCRFATMRAGGL